MKKYILIALSLSVLTLVSCGNESDKNSSPDTNSTSVVNEDLNNANKTEKEKIRHELADEIDTQGWNSLGELSYDFDSDGEDDKLQIYSSAWFKPDEAHLFNDGANWMITITTKNGVYKIFENYIQSGLPEIDIGELYNEEPEKVIILTQNSSAGKSVTHYTYSDNVFYEELVYSTDSFTQNGANIVESTKW